VKKMLFGLCLSVAALGFLMSPARATADPPQAAPALSAADQAFLASLAAGVRTPTPVLAASKRPARPAIGKKALCTATANCWFGGTVSCQGNNSTTSCSAVDGNCSWGIVGYVICDSQYYSCPGSCCPADFCTRGDQCSSSCYPCSANYRCDYSSCTDNCECNYSTCPP
jgi:hypothetical protein